MKKQREVKTQAKAKSDANENQKRIENHKKAATHLEAAANHHRDAAEYHEKGNHKKAHQSAIYANGHCCIANEIQREDAKQHAISSM